MKTRLLCLVCVVGCGVDDGSSMQTVTLHGRGTQLLAIQAEGEAWRQVTLTADVADVRFPRGPFMVASVCDEPGLFNYYVTFAGPETTELFLDCTPAPTAVEVSLAEGSNLEGAIGPYPLFEGFSWNVPPGQYDVLVYAPTLTPPRYELRRGVSITTTTVLSFDLATTGSPLEPVDVATNALPSESQSLRTRLRTQNGLAASIRQPVSGYPRVWRVPAGALQTGDTQLVTATASLDKALRATGQLMPSGAAVTLELPPGLTAAAVTGGAMPRATWQSTEAWTSGYFYTVDADFTKLYDATVLDDWVVAKGSFSSIDMPDPAQLPGWRWSAPATAGYEWTLSLERERSEHEFDRAGWDDAFAAMRTNPALAARLAQRAKL